MSKTKRKWSDHPLVGRKIEYSYTENGVPHPAKIVDVKRGPMGTICVRLKPDNGGPEFWTPPFEYNDETTKEADNHGK